MRTDGRRADELRPFTIQRRFTRNAAGSVLVSAGRTVVLCTASVEEKVPDWLVGKNKGWVTGEYSMLPGSTNTRKPRERLKTDGRTTEIQRLVGRSLRTVVDLEALGPRTVTIDCDVLDADGGTRTASITGGFIALVEAIRSIEGRANFVRPPILQSVAAVSVGIVKGEPLLDLCYVEDSAAEVDMNVVMTGDGRFIEVQGTGEKATFDATQLTTMISLAQSGIRELLALQQQALTQ